MNAARGARALRTMLGVALGIAFGAATHVARAQPAAPAPSSPAPAEPSAQPAAPATLPNTLPPVATPHDESAAAGDAALEARYHGAFEALARGERDVAARLLQSIVDEAPQHSLAERARKLLSDLAATAAPPSPPSSWVSDENAPGVERYRLTSSPMIGGTQRPTAIARAELVFFQTVHGIALGAEVCAMADCEDAQPWVLSMMLGAGAGFGASWHFSRHGVTPGLSRALTDGVLWGAANGIGLAIALDAGDDASATGAFLAGGQLAGLSLAGLVYAQLEPSAGQVSLTASGGLWSLTAVGELVSAFSPNFGAQTWAWLLIASGNSGVLAGALLAASEPMTTSRVLLIDAGGLIGTLGGLGVAVLVQGNDIHATATAIPGLIGTLTGLGVAYYLTRDWDGGDLADATSLHLSLAPMRNGAVASLAGSW